MCDSLDKVEVFRYPVCLKLQAVSSQCQSRFSTVYRSRNAPFRVSPCLLAFNQLTFPSFRKNSVAISIPKHSDSSDLNNYRSVILTATLFKTVVSDQLHPFLECGGLLTDRQYGFLLHCSTVDLSAVILHPWLGALHYHGETWTIWASPRLSIGFGTKACRGNFFSSDSIRLWFRRHRVSSANELSPIRSIRFYLRCSRRCQHFSRSHI